MSQSDHLSRLIQVLVSLGGKDKDIYDTIEIVHEYLAVTIWNIEI